MESAACWHASMTCFTNATLNHLPRDAATQSGLGPPASTIHQENAPWTSLMEVIHQLSFPLPKWTLVHVKLTKTHQHTGREAWHCCGWEVERTEEIKAKSTLLLWLLSFSAQAHWQKGTRYRNNPVFPWKFAFQEPEEWSFWPTCSQTSPRCWT